MQQEKHDCSKVLVVKRRKERMLKLSVTVMNMSQSYTQRQVKMNEMSLGKWYSATHTVGVLASRCYVQVVMAQIRSGEKPSSSFPSKRLHVVSPASLTGIRVH